MIIEQAALPAKVFLIAIMLAVFVSPIPAAAKKHKKPAIPISEAEKCNLKFAGKSRETVKLRTVTDGEHYFLINNGQPISVQDWLTMACSTFDPHTEGKAIKDSPIPGVETQKVTVKGYLMAARFENGGDHDIHAELADEPTWSTTNPHVIVEVPPGGAYCAARKELWDLVKGSVKHGRNYAVLENGPKISVTGYVFLDRGHGGSHFCINNGGRGIKGPDGLSNVQGLWEVHPVLEIKPLN